MSDQVEALRRLAEDVKQQRAETDRISRKRAVTEERKIQQAEKAQPGRRP